MNMAKQLEFKFMEEGRKEERMDEEARLGRTGKILYSIIGIWYSSFLTGLAYCAYQSRHEILEDFARIFG